MYILAICYLEDEDSHIDNNVSSFEQDIPKELYYQSQCQSHTQSEGKITFCSFFFFFLPTFLLPSSGWMEEKKKLTTQHIHTHWQCVTHEMHATQDLSRC